MTKSDLHPGFRAAAAGLGILTMTALFGCTTSNQPTAQASVPASVAAPSASADPSGTASPSARGGRPTIDALRTALTGYFRDDQDMTAAKAQTAANCAVYPSYQELSVAGLKQLAQQNPAGLSAADEKVFSDVVTECVNSANGS